MSVHIEKIIEPLGLGEGPHWDAVQQALYFVDIKGCTIHKYVPSSGKHVKTKLDGHPGFIVPVEGAPNQFVVGVDLTFLVIEWDGMDGSTTRVIRDLGSVDQGVNPEPRFNDGKADPRGRLFAGTMGGELPTRQIALNCCSLYHIDNTGVKKICGDISLSNGLAWDLKEKAFYYTDSLEYKIRRYDYDVETGEISNMKYFFDLKKNNLEGIPDGMTIDTDGNLWIAVFNGGRVIKVNPKTGGILQTILMPVPLITSVTFGGPNYDILFVTSANVYWEGVDQRSYPSGATFTVTGLGVRGTPSFNCKLQSI